VNKTDEANHTQTAKYNIQSCKYNFTTYSIALRKGTAHCKDIHGEEITV